ncbi:ubiquitin carboxyl-terminal hydrolase 1 [Drosophila serrata]|uniref:ubiquitin carboxyl-terminal hydrolase 1 n=1 Tax=Drosophila serrata TaxID=7274 RepID=UPI000A1D1B9C|nr:ubiquitin carboxyl-terminal hydrolase 1 [Drosophila serrata]XP_020811801.1 ubiquitin carboxyl-terminal hydrolase 1 [Drosophila serrata]XP_020811802.1 ubiquitin carboxyl-terminal hydrolase 1 [Drosophila serrata]XP_020811803.1 ubiquitin carboxyl-terminal hydrolase 1 [Drosophila serrata]XP_020811805.1 ubiquitin carboxyl-terminal hydrolase 1 [Drosophila serrata]
MHEYDVNERKEEPASLPLPRSDTSDTRSTNNSETQISQQDLQLQTQQEQQQEQQEEQHQPQEQLQEQQEEHTKSLPLLPQVLELIDRVVVANSEVVELSEPQKKRQRRVYVANSTRCASLRSQNKPPPPPPGGEGEVKPPSPSSLPPAQAAASPTPTESPIEYIKPEQFKPEFWNCIEEQEPERKTAAKKRRGGTAGGRTRTRRNQILNDLEIYSPETAAAIAAAQAELDATGKSTGKAIRGRGASRASRKRILTDTTTTATTSTSTTTSAAMSLYDRRYQSTTDERRGVANGYGSGNNGLRAGNAAGQGSASGASDIGESQEMSQSGHQYYGSAGSSNPTGAGSGLNGSASAALNHAPSMGTLCNIGNTCYLNSVVYTLRFAPHFLHNLHHLIQDLTVVQQTMVRQQQASKSASLGRNVSAAQLEHARSWSSKDLVASTDQQQQQYSGLNGGSSGAASSASNANASGSGKPSHQSVTENLHELYNNLHGNEMADSTEPYHADTLLHAIQDVNATFEGNQQQDAHEFLMCVLNCIRETNQSLIKSIGECPEVIANGYIANPDDVDSGEGQDRTDSAAISSNNGSLATTSHITTTKTSFFSRKSKRKDEVKSSKATRIQSPLKDKDNSPTTTGGISGAGHATANSLFYLNTVDLTGGGGGGTPTPPPAMPQPTKYSSDDDTNSATLLKDKMRLEERIKELNLNFFSSDFEGIVVLTTKCLSCETVTRQKQGMLDISVPVPISGYDNELQDKQPSTYIQSSCMTKEYFRGENKYSCNQCTGYTEAIRSISYEVLPRLLVIQLNRFSGGMEKVSTYVPTTFTLPCFCAKCCDLAEGHKLHVYKLYSVITHVGATLTVGHYIAYTCFLDLASDYVNCPKDRRNTIMTGNTQTIAAAAEAENSAPSSTPVAAAASALASSGSNLMKKMKFGRGKTSSSGDLSKNLKQLNGISSKTITNGIGKLSMNNTICHGVQCCAMRLCCSNSSNSNSASCSDFSEESLQNGSNSNLSSGGAYPTGYGSTGRGGVKANYVHGGPDPIWYMCDDDKIKAMSQREFEELLSPTRKITITPYLLFYARFDLQTPAKPGTSSTPPPPAQPPGSAQSSSWSNDNSKI